MGFFSKTAVGSDRYVYTTTDNIEALARCPLETIPLVIAQGFWNEGERECKAGPEFGISFLVKRLELGI